MLALGATSIPGRRGREDGCQMVSLTQSPKIWPCHDVTGTPEVGCTPPFHPEQKNWLKLQNTIRCVHFEYKYIPANS